MTTVTREVAKRVETKDASGNPNGFLIEMFKDGDKTVVYLSAAAPGAFKGYHLHRIREARYICLKGKMRIITYEQEDGKWQKTENVLEAANQDRLFIPKNIATGLENIGDEEAWLVNYPNPVYDPNLKDEQVEYTQDELEQGVVK